MPFFPPNFPFLPPPPPQKVPLCGSAGTDFGLKPSGFGCRPPPHPPQVPPMRFRPFAVGLALNFGFLFCVFGVWLFSLWCFSAALRPRFHITPLWLFLGGAFPPPSPPPPTPPTPQSAFIVWSSAAKHQKKAKKPKKPPKKKPLFGGFSPLCAFIFPHG